MALQLLQHDSSITYLNLGYNNIGPVGAQALLDVLDTNTTITTLDLRNTLSAKHNIRKTIDTILRQRNNQLLTSQPSTSVSQLTSASTLAPAVKSSSITRPHPHPTFSPHTLSISSPTHYTPGSKLQKRLEAYLDFLCSNGSTSDIRLRPSSV